MYILLEYLIVFIVISICYFIFLNKKYKKYSKKNSSLEMVFLVYVYNIDAKKVNYKRFNMICSIINSFIISSVYVIITYLVNGFIFQIIIGIILLLLLIIICYGTLARFYIKKGMVKCITSKK